MTADLNPAVARRAAMQARARMRLVTTAAMAGDATQLLAWRAYAALASATAATIAVRPAPDTSAASGATSAAANTANAAAAADDDLANAPAAAASSSSTTSATDPSNAADSNNATGASVNSSGASSSASSSATTSTTSNTTSSTINNNSSSKSNPIDGAESFAVLEHYTQLVNHLSSFIIEKNALTKSIGKTM
jgi:type IV secretory pathway VirJ component